MTNNQAMMVYNEVDGLGNESFYYDNGVALTFNHHMLERVAHRRTGVSLYYFNLLKQKERNNQLDISEQKMLIMVEIYQDQFKAVISEALQQLHASKKLNKYREGFRFAIRIKNSNLIAIIEVSEKNKLGVTYSVITYADLATEPDFQILHFIHGFDICKLDQKGAEIQEMDWQTDRIFNKARKNHRVYCA